MDHWQRWEESATKLAEETKDPEIWRKVENYKQQVEEFADKDTVTFADSYLRANIEFRNKACTRGKYYSYTEVIFVLFIFI